jgi:hypothetical protein
MGGQPPPEPSEGPNIWDLVVDDMQRRSAHGIATYGVPLRGHNGRKALSDAYEEALDLAVYLRQELYEREGR